jgi:hypothetical protein
MKKVGMTSLLLVAVNVAMACIVTLVWKRGEERVVEPDNMRVPVLELPDLSAMNSIPMVSVDVIGIREQAVFYSSRTFYVPPTAPVLVPPPDYEFNGTLRLPEGKRTAFVKRRGDSVSRVLHVGDDLDGWHVHGIEADRVALDLDGRTAELTSTRGGSFTPGLIRTTSAVRPAGISGLQSATQSAGTEARFYRPPSPVPK